VSPFPKKGTETGHDRNKRKKAAKGWVGFGGTVALKIRRETSGVEKREGDLNQRSRAKSKSCEKAKNSPLKLERPHNTPYRMLE